MGARYAGTGRRGVEKSNGEEGVRKAGGRLVHRDGSTDDEEAGNGERWIRCQARWVHEEVKLSVKRNSRIV
jgi:hypothetical protein